MVKVTNKTKKKDDRTYGIRRALILIQKCQQISYRIVLIDLGKNYSKLSILQYRPLVLARRGSK